MDDYFVTQVSKTDGLRLSEVKSLLSSQNLELEASLDYISAIFDEDGKAIATGSAFGSSLRCFAVSSSHQGEGLLNLILSHLLQWEAEQGNVHLFLYTKEESAVFFSSLGFHEIARVKPGIVFMENRRNGFETYLSRLKRPFRQEEPVGAVVMNANPFTLGHLHLIEEARKVCPVLHVFVLSEDRSFFPFSLRKRLVEEGTSHLDNVIIHSSGSYIISSATFPSYFLKKSGKVVEGHARLDAELFKRIASALDISRRFVGEEPLDEVTKAYNQVLLETLPESGVEVTVIPRKKIGDAVISASEVRRCFQEGDFGSMAKMVPPLILEHLALEANRNK